MNIFIDESGIHKNIDHSTTAVVYVEIGDLPKFETDFSHILEKLRICYFHWSEERWLIRNKFLKLALKLPFRVKIAVFKNPIHPDKMLELVFQHLIVETNISKVYIDGKKPRWYEHKLKKILRDKGITVRKLKTVRSEITHPGLQLADAIAGLVRYHHDAPHEIDAKNWISKLKSEKKLFVELLFGGAQ